MLQTHFVESGLEEISVDLHVDKGCPSKPLLQGPPRIVVDQSPELGPEFTLTFASCLLEVEFQTLCQHLCADLIKGYLLFHSYCSCQDHLVLCYGQSFQHI